MPSPFLPKILPQKRRPPSPYDEEDETSFVNRANSANDDADLDSLVRARSAAAKSAPQVGDVAAANRANAPRSASGVGGARRNGTMQGDAANDPNLKARAAALGEPFGAAPAASGMRQRISSIGASAPPSPEQQRALLMRSRALADGDDENAFSNVDSSTAHNFEAGDFVGTFDGQDARQHLDAARATPTLGDRTKPVRNPDAPAAPNPADPGEPEDPELAAAREQYEVDKARQLQNQGARNGFSGLGLFGGSETALQDTARAATRNETTGLADLKRKIGDEKWNEIRRQTLLDDAEQSLDEDVDHDGDIGGHAATDGWGDGDPSNNKDAGDKSKPNKPKFDDEVNFAGDSPDRHGIEGTALNPDDFKETTSVHPPVDEYVGSTADGKFDLYVSHLDGKRWKVPRAKDGQAGVRA